MSRLAWWALLATILTAGCASSGVIQTNPNEYMLTKQSAGGLFVSGDEVKADLYIEAGRFCAAKSKVVETISGEGRNAIPFVRSSQATLTFRCATP